MRKRCRLWQTAETRRNPGAMTLSKVLRIDQITARRHCQNGFALAWMNSECVTARTTMAPELNSVDRRADFNGKGARFSGTAIKKCTKGHVSGSGQQEF